VVQVGYQARADRYTYLPQIGLYLLVAWATTDALASWPHRGRILGATAAIVIIAFTWSAWIQASYWCNSESLWVHTLAVTSENPIAHNNLAVALTKKGRTDEAIAHIQTVLKLYPNDAKAYYNLGNALLQKGQLDDAIAAYEKALSIQTRFADAHYNLAIALTQKGEVDAAIAEYQKAVQDKPDYAQAYYTFGNGLLKKGNGLLGKGRIDEAIAQYEHVLKMRPDYPEVQNNIAVALMQKGRPSEAIAHWQKTLELKSDFVDALNNLAWVLATFPETSIRNGAKAMALAERAHQLSGDSNPAIFRTLAAAYAENGRFIEARDIAERGLQLAKTQENSALADIFEGDIALYRTNAPVRTAVRPGNSSSP
jgi:tetratricopeptide (TPR) repeat protein